MVPSLVSVCGLAPVADNVHATDHLADGEEADDLSGGDTGEGELLGAGVADASQPVLGRGEVDALKGGRVLGGVDQGLEVGLESGHGTRDVLDRVCGAVDPAGRLTEETCSGHGTPACRAQCRP